MIPLLIGIVSVLLLPMMKIDKKFVNLILVVQTFLLSYTLVSSPNDIYTIYNYSSLNYTFVHLLMALVPLLLVFNII